MKLPPVKTYHHKAADLQASWHLVDAHQLPLGRLATVCAQLLIGKHKPTYSPHLDNGDWVVVINAQTVALSGRKEEEKVYYRHSGYPGSLKQRTVAQQRQRDATKLVRQAIYGMLPKNKLRAGRNNRLKIYAQDVHPHHGQQPVPYPIVAGKS